MEPLLKVNNVSITYKLGDFKDIGLKEWVTRHLTKNFHVEQFMAVDGVSFELYEGELLGIVGANGAGKSTILKAVAGIMEPRSGSIERRGSVAALLELGSGFDGELTVKENAYLRGAMLGYDEKFMDETYQEIIRFAELEKFADRPFKQLSTGMQSRLAFSIASLVQPEILVLDEVLSVGDGAFQEKSARKMREIIDGGAATILVSHSLSQIRELSTRVLWLHHGKQVALGETERICDRYEAFLDGDETALRDDWIPRKERRVCVPKEGDWEAPEEAFAPRESINTADERFGLGYVEIADAYLLDSEGSRCDVLKAPEPFDVVIDYRVHRRLEEYIFGFAFTLLDGTFISGSNTKLDAVRLDVGREGTVTAHFESMPLLSGEYILQVAVTDRDETPIDYWRDRIRFKVVSDDRSAGYVTVPHTWSSST